MLEYLHQKATSRKKRLFACAYCRSFWNLLHDERSRRAVESAESFADALIGNRELRVAEANASEAIERPPGEGWFAAIAAKMVAAKRVPWRPLCNLGQYIDQYRSGSPGPYTVLFRPPFQSEKKAQLIRDIFGSPFYSGAVEPMWLSWNAATVQRLARGIYDDRAFDRLAILADALEDAGCDNAAILAHCRGPGPHVRGCWVVDLILGKS
jgi:hypothetical protein